MALVSITYQLMDDSGGGLTGMPVGPEFNSTGATAAVCLAQAQVQAQIFATMFQRNVRLAQKYNSTIGPPWTPLYTASSSLALSNAPSGITSP
jgi:hypothetical protein